MGVGVQLASSIVQADATNNTFLERVQAALYKMLDALKNNDATQCITEHVQKEHMVVAFSYPWGVSVECMLDWDCYYCVDRVQKTSNFFYLAVLKSALSALTESELEDMLGVVCSSSLFLVAAGVDAFLRCLCVHPEWGMHDFYSPSLLSCI